MEMLLEQRHRFALISHVKNYESIDFFKNYGHRKALNIVLMAKKEKRSNIRYFNTKNNDAVTLYTPNDKLKFYTEKDNQIKRNYNNPFANIEVFHRKRQIFKKEEKLIIKVFTSYANKNHNFKVFTKHTTSKLLLFNFKTGNIYVINESTQNGKKVGNKIFCNSFTEIKNTLATILNPSFVNEKTSDESMFNQYVIPHYFKDKYDKLFSNSDFISIFNKNMLNNGEIPIKQILDFFIEKKKIRVPNDYQKLMLDLYPTQKFLKKNENKLIQAILDRYQIKTKATIKLMHENKINFSALIDFRLIFGEDFYKYLNVVDNQIFDSTVYEGGAFYLNNGQYPPLGYNLDKEEKLNLLHVINDSINKTSYFQFGVLFRDHMSMINTLRPYFPNKKITTKDYDSFMAEHTEMSEIVTKIFIGITNQYIFDEKLIDDIEPEFLALRDFDSLIKLKAVILKTEEDYKEEGKFMHHCVATYSKKATSIIISLRSQETNERVTSEFDIQSGRCIQSRYYCNQEPPEHFKDGLTILKEKVRRNAKWGLLNWKEHKVVPITINGIEVKRPNNNPLELVAEEEVLPFL